MNPRAPQTNPNLLSTQKHINSDWVRVCYFSGARKRNSRRREARKRVGLSSFLSMKKGMANHYYLCLAITWFFLLKKGNAQVLNTSLRRGAQGAPASIASHGILFQYSSFLPELFILCGALSTCATQSKWNRALLLQPICIIFQKTILRDEGSCRRIVQFGKLRFRNKTLP